MSNNHAQLGDSFDDPAKPSGLNRRQVLKATAWATPAIVIAASTPVAAASARVVVGTNWTRTATGLFWIVNVPFTGFTPAQTLYVTLTSTGSPLFGSRAYTWLGQIQSSATSVPCGTNPDATWSDPPQTGTSTGVGIANNTDVFVTFRTGSHQGPIVGSGSYTQW